MKTTFLVLSALALQACSASKATSDTDTVSTGTDASSDADADAGTDARTDAMTETDTSPPPTQPPSQSVYAGCATPPTTFNHTWYVDPVNGKTPAAGADGSQANPWNSLQGLVGTVQVAGVPTPTSGYPGPLVSTVIWPKSGVGETTTPNAPIQPGDEILLMSGNYGDIAIGEYLQNESNPVFVTIAAAPNQTPVFTSLYIASGDRWRFSGIEVQSLHSSTNSGVLVQVTSTTANPSANIVLDNMLISSQDDISAWTQANWLARGQIGFDSLGIRTTAGSSTTCVSMTNSHITNVTFGVAITSDNTFFANNEVDHFGDDGLDYAGSNLKIYRNYIHDNNSLGDGNHEDAMQGQNGSIPAGLTYNSFSNIVIDSNTVIRQQDPKLMFPTYLQGIDAFDEDWTNITVTNNMVITSSCWGIVYSSIHNSLIANNTIADDGLFVTPGCGPSVAVGDKTHEGPSSNDVQITNNITSGLAYYNLDPGITADHNIITLQTGFSNLSYYVNGAAVFFSAAGSLDGTNLIDNDGAVGEFTAFSPSTLTYDLTLKPGAQAHGYGAQGANIPTVNIAGTARVAPINAGAY